MTDRTHLYRLFDQAGALLYIGISRSGLSRLAQHLATKPWADTITDVRLEWHPNRSAALHAEREAIRNETPRYNLKHATSSPYLHYNPVERYHPPYMRYEDVTSPNIKGLPCPNCSSWNKADTHAQWHTAAGGIGGTWHFWCHRCPTFWTGGPRRPNQDAHRERYVA